MLLACLGRNWVYRSCCFGQMAHSPALTSSAKQTTGAMSLLSYVIYWDSMQQSKKDVNCWVHCLAIPYKNESCLGFFIPIYFANSKLLRYSQKSFTNFQPWIRNCFKIILKCCWIIPTQDTKPSLGRRPKDGFVSKWVYKFLPSQKLVHLSGYFKHHIGGGQLPKNTYEIL